MTGVPFRFRLWLLIGLWGAAVIVALAIAVPVDWRMAVALPCGDSWGAERLSGRIAGLTTCSALIRDGWGSLPPASAQPCWRLYACPFSHVALLKPKPNCFSLLSGPARRSFGVSYVSLPKYKTACCVTDVKVRRRWFTSAPSCILAPPRMKTTSARNVRRISTPSCHYWIPAQSRCPLSAHSR